MEIINKLSAVALLAKRKQLDNLVDKARGLLIEQGYGSETFPQAMERARYNPYDRLVVNFVANSLELRDIIEECKTREAFHGSLKPIKRKQ